MSAIIRFPNVVTMNKCLRNHALLKTPYFEEKGITAAISDLASERFAEKELVPQGVTIGTMLLIEDLQNGEDGFTGKPLPNLGKLGLRSNIWNQLTMSTEKAILDSAVRE